MLARTGVFLAVVSLASVVVAQPPAGINSNWGARGTGPAARVAADPNGAAGNNGEGRAITNGIAPIGNAAAPTLAPDAASVQPIRARVTKGSGVLPNDHNQVWREYDISPYTSKVTTTNRPQQAIVDWILRDTGTDTWFLDTLGVLHADKTKLRVYHTPEMQSLVEDVVNRFVSSQAETHALSLRLMTVGNPNWRARAVPLMRAVDVQSPGLEAWLLSKENAAVLVAELRRRADFNEHNSPNLMLHNGQSHTITRTRPRSYMRSVNWQPVPQVEMAQLEEGYSLEISPLYSLDGRTIDAVIKCHIDQVEKLNSITIEAPAAGGVPQRFQVQVPQIVSWRLHERFRWPADQVLLLSAGVVASPAPEQANPLGLPASLFGGTKGRADALLLIESKGKGSQPVAGPGQPRTARQLNPEYRGRY